MMGTDIITTKDLEELLGCKPDAAGQRMRQYKDALKAAGRDITNLQSAITIGDYCYVTGITVEAWIKWRQLQFEKHGRRYDEIETDTRVAQNERALTCEGTGD